MNKRNIMYFELTLEEATKLITDKLGGKANVKIILPEQKKEVFKDSRNDFSDKCIRVGLVRDVKRALTVIDSGKMFAIRYVRYRSPSLSLKDAKAFVEMDENECNNFIESGRLSNGWMLE